METEYDQNVKDWWWHELTKQQREDAMYYAKNKLNYEKMYEFIHYIATDYFELSHEKVRIQRDDYVRMARDLMKELNE